jgi:hypothetical protein
MKRLSEKASKMRAYQRKIYVELSTIWEVFQDEMSARRKR